MTADMDRQITRLSGILALSADLYGVIKQAAGAGLKDYYIGAGCIAQTVWNYQSGFDLTYGISDIDIAYYDDTDLSYGAEDETIRKINCVISSGKIRLDIKNQARVHIWYKEHFGYAVEPYESIESAISSWPTTATSAGVRLEDAGLKVYAPFGLDDMFSMTVRANKVRITKEIYMEKVRKWLAKWPSLTIIPW